MIIIEATQLLTYHFTHLAYCIFKAYFPGRDEK